VYDQLPQEQLGDIQDVAKTLPTRSSDAGKGLEEIYTEEQLEALREAEKAIDPRDLVTQARMRNDHWAPQTIEDFAYIDPQVDQDKAYAKLMKDITSDAFIPKVIKRLKDPRDTQELFQEAKQLNLKVEVKTFLNKLEDWCEANPAQFEEREAYVRDILHRYVTVPGTEEDNLLDEFATYNEQAEELQKKAPATEEESLEAAGMRRVAAETGFGLAELKKFRVKSLVFRRVVNQTRMGKIPSMYNLTVVGNGNGLIGIGEGKSAEMSDASRQAVLNALRNMKPIQRYENRTIFGKILKKVGGTTVEVTAKPPGMYFFYHRIRRSLMLT
jgi:small subunit ribosomal protein S5